ncbi:NAD(P)/FAD-dependent oxidoreductase [Streptomyces sp. NPDC014646]|uniref:NAD(P)/FAD-dependent oxidoreductase n=1 Tax=Streptomyces sp. NPDC014646 TaxID=3364877 RepID=UPI0036FE441E
MREQADVAVVGTGVVGLAVAVELLHRGLNVTVVGPRSGVHPGQGTRAAGAMLSTFSELEPHHDAQRAGLETTERLAAHHAYPAWLERIETMGGGTVPAPSGTWILAPAGRRSCLDPIAAAARAAGHSAEEHDASSIPALRAPASSAGALWLPTEARVDSAALMEALSRAVEQHPRATWIPQPATAADAGTVACTGGETVRARDVVLAAGCGIPALLQERGRPLGVPPILAGRGVSARLNAPAVEVEQVVRTPNAAFACGIHLVPRTDDTLYLGGTNRLTLDPDLEQPPALDEVAVLAADAAALMDPRLQAASLQEVRTGLRPYTLDHLPLIGRTGEPSVLLATATYRCGVLLAPRLAELVADEITAPGSLDTHPYRARRPMPVPSIDDVLAQGAAQGLVEHLLQGGGHLTPAQQAEFTAFTSLALRALLDEDSKAGAAVRRLWERAPVIEAVPALFALARRLEALR